MFRGEEAAKQRGKRHNAQRDSNVNDTGWMTTAGAAERKTKSTARGNTHGQT